MVCPFPGCGTEKNCFNPPAPFLQLLGEEAYGVLSQSGGASIIPLPQARETVRARVEEHNVETVSSGHDRKLLSWIHSSCGCLYY